MILSRCICGDAAGKHEPLNDRGTRRGRCLRGGCDCSAYARRPMKQDGEAFPERRDPKYTEWVKTLPCIAAGRIWKGTLPSGGRVTFLHQCHGPIDPAHVDRRSQGAPDVGAVLPCCRRAHDWEATCGGIKVWAAGYGWTVDDMRGMAQALVPLWERDVLQMHTL